MRRILRQSLVLLGLAATLALVLAGAAWLAGNTDAGRAALMSLTDRWTGGRVRIAGLSGRFPAHLIVERLELRDARGLWLTARHVTLDWWPPGWLGGRLPIDALTVQELDLERAPVPAAGGGSPSIPHIEVRRFSVESLRLGAALAGEAVTLRVTGDAVLRSLEDAEARLAIDRVDGAGRYRLELRFDPRSVQASLRLSEPAGGPLEHLLGLPGLGALEAAATLEGPRGAARVALRLDAGPLSARATGTVDLPARTVNLEYSLVAPASSPRPGIAWRRLEAHGTWRGPWSAPTAAAGRLEVLELQLPGGLAAASLRADLAAHEGRLDVHAGVEGLRLPGPNPDLLVGAPLAVDATVRLDRPDRPVELAVAHALFGLQAHAATAGARHAEFELQVADLRPFAALVHQDVRGGLTATGRIMPGEGSWRLGLEARLALGRGGEPWAAWLGSRATLEVGGSASGRRVELGRLRIAGAAGSLDVSGEATRPPTPGPYLERVQARWSLHLADLGLFSDRLEGALEASGKLAGPTSSLQMEANVTADAAPRGVPRGKVSATVRAVGLPRAPSVTVAAHGSLDEAPLELLLALERAGGGGLHAVLRRADWKSVHAEADLSVDQALERPSGALQLRIGRLSDLDALTGMHLQGDLQVTGRGTLRALDLQLAARSPAMFGAAATLTAHATLDGTARALRIADAEAEIRGERIRLTAPARIAFADGVVLGPLQVGVRDALLKAQGRLSPALDARLSLRDVKADLIDAFAGDWLARGTLSGRVRLGGTLAAPTGSVHLEAAGLRLAGKAAEGLPPIEGHADGRLDGPLDGRVMTVEAAFSAGPNSELAVSGAAPLDAAAELDLRVRGGFDLALVNALFEARGLRVTGRAALDGAIIGPLGEPRFAGTISLDGGSFRDFGRGIEFTNIAAELRGADGMLTIERFKAAAASGEVTVTGDIGVLEPGVPVNLQVTARNARPVASAIVTTDLDADLTVTGKALERLDVGGTMTLKRTVIGIANSLPPEVAVLDVRRRGAPAVEASRRALVVGLDLRVSAPREVLVQGRGLDAELGGELHIGGTAAEPTVGGGFDLQRGNITFAGRRLDFTAGRVGFDGTGLRKKIDPTLDFTAQAALTDATATLRVSGHADAPRFTFTSVPSMPADEIMCRLLFGQCTTQPSALQAAQIAGALASLSGVGGGGLNPLARLQKSLGLDRLSVGSANTGVTPAGESSGASIQAGRYLSRRIYIQGTQTTAGSSQVEVDVELNKHFKLQTRLGNGTAITQGTTPENDPGSSIGLSYTFEY